MASGSVKQYASSIEITPGVTCGGTTNYKCWSELDNLKSNNGVAYCRKPDNTDTYTIAGKNGTYRQPAPLTFTGFNPNLPDSYSIDKVVLHYKTQKFINNGFYPDIGGATITLLGTGQANKTGRAVSETKTEDTITWTGLTLAQVNSTSFGVKIAFPSNTSTTPGYIILENVYLEIFYQDNGVKLTVNTQFSSNPVVLNDNIEAEFTVKKTSTEAYNSTTIIDLPPTVEAVSTGVITNGNVSVQKVGGKYEFQRITWKHNMSNGTTTDTLTYQLRAIKTTTSLSSTDKAVQQCIIKDNSTGISYTDYLKVNDITITVDTNLFSNKVPLSEGKYVNVNVTFTSNDISGTNKVLWVNINDGAGTLDLSSINFDAYLASAYNESNTSYWIRFKDTGAKTVTIPLRIKYDYEGAYTAIMFITESGATKHLTELQRALLVQGKDLGQIGFARILIPDTYTQNMGHAVYYTMGSQVKYILDTTKYKVIDHGSNLRIGVFNEKQEYVNDEDAFVEHVQWCENISSTTGSEQKVTFLYNEKNPLYFVYSHEYSGNPLNPYVVFNFSEPWLVERDYYNTTPIRDLRIHPLPRLVGNVGYATGTFGTTIEKSVLMNTYNWDHGGTFDEKISILGLEVMFDYVCDDTLWVNVECYLGWSLRGSRDIILQKGSGTAHAGSAYDLFGFKPADFVGRLNNLQIKLQVFNHDKKTPLIQLDDVRIQIKYANIIQCGYGLSIDGEKSQYYGFIVSDVVHHNGTQNEKTLYHVAGTDETVINRLNVDSKDITVTIFVPDCTLENTMYLVDRIVELFTNNREYNSNKPIPKQLVFDHIPDRYFSFVRIEEFDDEIVGNSYKAKIKLNIPDGTTYALQETITGAKGNNPSTITVKPTITYKANTASKLVINEARTGQSFIVNNSKITNGATVVIDVPERTVTVGNTDITSSVDFNSNWFRVKGEYEFTSSTGNIQSVSYRVRR